MSLRYCLFSYQIILPTKAKFPDLLINNSEHNLKICVLEINRRGYM